MDQDLCEHLYVRHLVDSKKTGREHRPEKPYKKWKRRWVVLSGNISPSKCFLNYCKTESDWLSKNQSEISKCQLTSFSVQKVTGRGEHDNHLVISLRTYAICLSFESVTKMDQWYKALERLLECYQVILECPEHRDLEGDHVVQFSLPGQFKVWGMDGQLQWEWSLQVVRRVHYHQSSDQLEIEAGRAAKTGEGKFIFTGPLVFKLFLVVKEAMKASREKSSVQQDAPPQARPSSQSPTLTDQFYVSGRSESSASGVSLGRLSIVSAPEMVPRRPPTVTRGLSSVSSPASPETVVRRQAPCTATRGSPSQSKGTLTASMGDYMQLRFRTENPASEYVELCRDHYATPPCSTPMHRPSAPPREDSLTPEDTDGYILPHQFYTALPPCIYEEDHNTASLSLDSDDST